MRYTLCSNLPVYLMMTLERIFITVVVLIECFFEWIVDARVLGSAYLGNPRAFTSPSIEVSRACSRLRCVCVGRHADSRPFSPIGKAERPGRITFNTDSQLPFLPLHTQPPHTYTITTMDSDAHSHRSRATGVSRKSSIASRQSQLIKKNTGMHTPIPCNQSITD